MFYIVCKLYFEEVRKDIALVSRRMDVSRRTAAWWIYKLDERCVLSSSVSSAFNYRNHRHDDYHDNYCHYHHNHNYHGYHIVMRFIILIVNIIIMHLSLFVFCFRIAIRINIHSITIIISSLLLLYFPTGFPNPLKMNDKSRSHRGCVFGPFQGAKSQALEPHVGTLLVTILDWKSKRIVSKTVQKNDAEKV